MRFFLNMEKSLISTDEELIKLISQGDEMAFSQLYRRHWEFLYTTAVKVLRSEDFAVDVVQDVFHSLWIRREEIVIKNAVRGYLYTSVRYKSLNIIKKELSDKDYLDVLMLTIAKYDNDDGQQILQLKELKQNVEKVINSMPEKMKKVYELSRFENLSHQEISVELGISKETVKKHIQHALLILKKSILLLFTILLFVKR